MADVPSGASGRRTVTMVGSCGAVVLLVIGAVLVLGRDRSTVGADSPSTGSTGAPAVAETPPSTTTTPTSAPLATTTSSAPPCDRRAELDAGTEAAPAPWLERVQAAVDSPGWGAVQRSISVWVAGYGEVAAVDGDVALLPASNEKLLTAIGARRLLDPAHRFRTEVRLVDDRLVLVAGGDPTLRSQGDHSLVALARQVRAAGVTRVASVGVDASHFEAATSAAGWQDWQIPTYAGPLSALTVDDNRGRADPAYLADPAVGNAEAFVGALRAAGVAVDGPLDHVDHDGSGEVVAVLESAPVDELSDQMLVRSDNEIAEALVREVGEGVTATGLERITASLEPWCLHLAGTAGDGSGLSRDDWRSAREWRRILQVAAEQPWADDLWDGLPVAGRTGTLSGRLTGPSTAGVVRAKTGTIIGGTALSGYATTPDGRPVVFSIVVNGEPTAAAATLPAIDRLVAAVVAG